MNSTQTETPGLLQNGRSGAEILMRTFAFYFCYCFVRDIQTSFRRQPRKVASYQLLAVMLIPAFPLDEICISIYRTYKAWQRASPRASKRYYLCAALDMRAVTMSNDSEESVPLSLLGPNNVECRFEPYTLRRCTRLLALFLYEVQMLMTMWLWTRRLLHDGLSVWDGFTATVALGGLVAAAVTITIEFLSTNWRVEAKYYEKFTKYYDEPSPGDLLVNLLVGGTFIELQIAALLGLVLRSITFFTAQVSTYQTTATTLSGKVSVDEAKTLVELVSLWGSCGFSWFGMMWISIYALRLLRTLFDPSFSPLRMDGDPWSWLQGVSYIYFFLTNCLFAMGVMDIVSAGQRELWMWKDQWSARFWVI